MFQVEVDLEKINAKVEMEIQKEAARPGAKPYNNWEVTVYTFKLSKSNVFEYFIAVGKVMVSCCKPCWFMSKKIRVIQIMNLSVLNPRARLFKSRLVQSNPGLNF